MVAFTTASIIVSLIKIEDIKNLADFDRKKHSKQKKIEKMFYGTVLNVEL